MTSKKLLLAGVIAALGLAGASQAATITVRPTNVTVHNPGNFTQTVDASSIVSRDATSVQLVPRAEPYVLKIDVLINASELAGAQLGFGNVDFNLDLSGNLTRNAATVPGGSAPRPNWRLDSTQVSVDGENAPKWADNSDLGTPNDLKHIVMGIAPKNFGDDDPRKTLGVAPFNNPAGTNYDGEYAGAIYVDLPGAAGSVGRVTAVVLGGSTYNPNNDLVAGGNFVGGFFEARTTPIPEPSTLALLGLGSALLVFARKRR